MLWAFFVALAFFHTSEFALACVYHPEEVSFRSLLFSTEYIIAMSAAIVEFYAESLFIPSLKMAMASRAVQWLGLAMVVLGEASRKLAIITAGKSFTHDIKRKKRESHRLVTTGIYRFVRHPSYMGWFMWSVGTQLMLANPICTIAFAVMSWRFFSIRIPYEEFFLHQFFGFEYAAYAVTVPSGVPFVP